MDIVVTTEYRFYLAPDGSVWSDGVFGNSFWQRYLEVFDKVIIYARALAVSKPEECYLRVDSPSIQFHPVKYYIGPKQFILSFPSIINDLRKLVNARCAVIYRVPSILSMVGTSLQIPTGKPYGMEVVGDPYEVFARGTMAHPLRPIFRRLFVASLKKQCLEAAAIGYVTRETLQKRYPPSSKTFSTYYSSIELPDDWFVEVPRQRTIVGNIKLVSVGAMDQMYKGYDILFEAIRHVRERGFDVSLDIVGDGRYRDSLEQLARALGVGEHIHFAGRVPMGAGVRAYLDAADIFVLASRTEGLPRVVIEAMARGLPCVASGVGGVPELLGHDDMVFEPSPIAFANKLMEVISNDERLKTMSESNLKRSHEYADKYLQNRRNDCYRALKQRTEQYILDQ